MFKLTFLFTVLLTGTLAFAETNNSDFILRVMS